MASDKTMEIVEQVGKHIRSGSLVVADNVRRGSLAAAEQFQEVRMNTPRYKQQAKEIYQELRDPSILRLRQPGEGMTLQQLIKEHEAGAADLSKLTTPAAAALCILALRSASSLNHLVDVWIRQLFTAPTRTAKVALAATVAPGCLLAWKYEYQLMKESGLDGPGWPMALLIRNYRRLPPAFYLAASASCAVTAKATFDASEAILHRLFKVRFLTLASIAAMYWLVKQDGKQRVAEALAEFKKRLPPQIQEHVDKALAKLEEVLKLVEAKIAPAAESLKTHVSPVIEQYKLRTSKVV